MARCDRGYPCTVCGVEVETLVESDLYLRYALGEVPQDELPRAPERHIRCNPALAQFIVADGFDPVSDDGPFSKAELDPDFVASEESRVTEGFLHLLRLAQSSISIFDYVLGEERGSLEVEGDSPKSA